MFGTLVVAIALGHPLAVTLAGVATLYGLVDNGFNIPALLDLFVNNAWGIFLNYTLVAVPLFIFMAQILDRSKVSEGLFDALYIVLGGLRGGLGMAVIVVSTVFAATTGIIGASVVAMGLMAGPALLRRGYDRGMSAGIICSSGTLGILIPPSIMLVVYGGLTGLKETSVGNLFAGAIIPGLVLSGLYLVYVAVRCGINPKLGPPIPREEHPQHGTEVHHDHEELRAAVQPDPDRHGHDPCRRRHPHRSRGARLHRRHGASPVQPQAQLGGTDPGFDLHRTHHRHDHGTVHRRQAVQRRLFKYGRRRRGR